VDERSQYRTALGLAKRALDYIARYQTPPTPHAYELFYTVCAGQNQDLNKALADIIAEKRTLSAADAERLYREFLSEQLPAKTMESIGSQMNGHMTGLLALLGSAATSSSSYQASLENAEQKLSGGAAPQNIEALVGSLLTATKTMAQTNTKIAETLETSRAQVTQLEDCLKVAREESARDALTGLIIRKHFDRLLDEAILNADQSGQPISLIVADIDHFKVFNDTYGHIAGDSALRYVSSCIKTNIKAKDTAARYGGEEFVVILPNTGLERAFGVAERIRHLINSRELVKKATNENMGRISVSAGVTELHEGDTAESFLNRADLCMYAAKNSGRNQVLDSAEPEATASSAA